MYTYFFEEYFNYPSFRFFLSPAVPLHPPTEIPVPNDQTSVF